MNKLLRRSAAAVVALVATAAFAVDPEPHMKVKVCDQGETLCADVITSGGQSRLTVDSSPASNVVSSGNTTTVALGSSATFTGSFEDLLGYADVVVAGKADQASAALGLVIEWSNDGSAVTDTDAFTAMENSGFQYSFGSSARYVRVKYTNGGVAQGSFSLQTILKRTRGKPSSHRIEDSINGDNDAELVKSVVTGKDPSGVYQNLRVDADGNLITTALTGFGSDFAFGDVTTAASAQVAVRRTAYTEQTVNAQRSFVSTDVDDDGSPADTGARTLRFIYLETTGAGPFSETITLNGTTCVATAASNIAFIELAEVVTVGATGSNEGTISMFVNAACGGGTIGTIAVNNNQTFWAHHYVPTGKTANITGLSANHNGTTVGSGGVFVIKSKVIGVAEAVETQVSDFHRLYGQSSTTPRTYISPIPVDGPTRLTVYVTPETTSSTVYRGSMDFFQP